MKNIEVNIGDRYGRLEVIEPPYSYRSPSGQMKRKVRCRCDCGKEKEFFLDLLARGHTKSCGCFSSECIKERRTTHGSSYDKLYSVRRTMIQRCTNPNHKNYARYGGRGIKVCSEWLRSFDEFKSWSLANGYRDGLTIDRIDNNGDYEPSNCRFVSMKVQSNNRRNSKFYEIDGEEMTLSQICDKYNVSYPFVAQRVRAGWSVEKAVFTPKKKNV